MPFGDGTGPLGKGPMTGRRGGGLGRGQGMGRGKGMGRGRGIVPTPVPTRSNNPSNVLSKEDEALADEIYNILPKIDCGSCGYPTCRGCARAIVEGKVPYDVCKILRPEQQEKIKEILQRRR